MWFYITIFHMDRSQFPRPDFIRSSWFSLSGEWEFSFDDQRYDRKIIVPFCPESELSNIGERNHAPLMWYRKVFQISDPSKRYLLHFGAVDHNAEVFLNGRRLGSHRGCYSPFSFDITGLIAAENILEVRVSDQSSPYELEGKQRWGGRNFGCWYTDMSGIWQDVWIEETGIHPVKHFMITPSARDSSATVSLLMEDPVNLDVEVSFSISGKDLGAITIRTEYGQGRGCFIFPDMDVRGDELLWSMAHPNLIDVSIRVLEDDGDEISTYFGLRDIEIQGMDIYLNRCLVYQRLVLMQGYWKDSLYTPPCYEAMQKDLELVKAMGFNGVRMHQKIEDPRFYYIADTMGLLVWEELPSWHRASCYSSMDAVGEAFEMVRRDYNHPSIITWVPLNESWGVSAIRSSREQQCFAAALYRLLKSLDPTRMVSTNDGWEQISDADIFTIHDYMFSSSCSSKYEDPSAVISRGVAESKALLADGQEYRGQPVILSEFGGIAFSDGTDATWGYYGKVKGADEFKARIKDAVAHLVSQSGWCYTQFSDVEQETNGLVTVDRVPKLPVEEYRQIFG